jgi:maltose-binding protein MalE
MRLFLFALIISGIFLCAGCARKTNDSDTYGKPLTVWYLNNTTGLEPAIIQAASEFSASEVIAPVLYKACTALEIQLLAEGRDIAAKPDLIIIPSEYLALLARGNALQRTSNLIDQEITAAVQACMWKGASWAIPIACDTRMLFINRNLFQTDFSTALSITFEKIWSSTALFTGSPGGFWVTHSDEPEMMYRSILPWMSIYGADVFDQNRKPVLTSSNNVQALASYAELAREGTVETERYLDAAITQGTIGFGYGRASLVRNSWRNQQKGTVVTQLHHADNHASAPPIVFTTVACITRNAANTSLATRFIAAVKKNIEHNSVSGFPTMRSYWTSSENSESQNMKLISQSILNGRNILSDPQWNEVNVILQQAYTRVVLGLAEPAQSLQQAQYELLQLQDS